MSTNEIGGMCGTAFECLPVCPSSIRTKLTHIYHLDDKWHNLAVGTRGRGHNWHILSICILCKYVCTQAGRGAMSRRYVVVGGICGVVGIQMEFGWMVSTQESVWQHSGMSTSSRRHWWALMQNKESQSTPIYPFCQGDTLWGYFKANALPHSADKSLHSTCHQGRRIIRLSFRVLDALWTLLPSLILSILAIPSINQFPRLACQEDDCDYSHRNITNNSSGFNRDG